MSMAMSGLASGLCERAIVARRRAFVVVTHVLNRFGGVILLPRHYDEILFSIRGFKFVVLFCTFCTNCVTSVWVLGFF